MKNSNKLTIVMYHYVREIKNSKFPDIKGLEIENFRRQLNYLQKNFNIITAEQLIQSVLLNKTLPSNSCYLTFDDGYKDHFQYVLPELISRGIQGSFFIPAATIIEKKILDVNKIHLILASTKDKLQLLKGLNFACKELGYSETNLKEYWNKHGKPDEFDTAEVIYIKRLLQHVLPEKCRQQIIEVLFKKYVGISEKNFSTDFYMSQAEIKKLIENNMYVGCHGYKHYWLNTIPAHEQELDIQLGLDFLKDVGASTENWIMCYPYGAYNENTLNVLKKNNCSIGLTTVPELADLNFHDRFLLPRFDTNHFPQ